ncbi:ArnT family glycosyltransferase [Acrocarpospora catenulata]|uniref:ArnT family glycosyltransferase n=1 Tax=Acrocarpospora catenulata TaxID=2836182 RepID=UPI001BD9E365|nr:glycosyltransferase family 39 protein [Acrocarpospora catenulata]
MAVLERLHLPQAAPGQAVAPPRRLLTYAPALLITVVVAVQLVNVTGYPAIDDDEGTYLAQAWALRQGSLAHYTYWYDHPPVGWLQIGAFSWIPELLFRDGLAVAAGRFIMPLVTGISALLLWIIARRLRFSPLAAGAAVLLFTLSPIALTLQRQLYLDNIAVPWVLGAYALALSPSRHLGHHVASGVCAAIAVLTKETMLLAVLPVAYTMWRTADPHTRTFSLAGLGSGLVLTGALYPLYALLKGELLPGPDHVSLWDAVRFQLSDRPPSGNMFVSGTGANELLTAWLATDPVIVVGGALSVVAGMAFSRLRPVALGGMILMVVGMRPSGYLPAMYIIGLLPFFAICAAGIAETLLRTAARALGRLPLPLRALPLVLRLRRLRPWFLAATVVAAAGAVLAVWLPGQARVLTVDANADRRAALEFFRGAVAEPQGVKVLVDDALWLDLRNSGFDPVWFYKADLDSAVRKELPGGWRDFDYVISSGIMRQDAARLPTVRDTLTHSTPLTGFGEGYARIEIRRVYGG